MPRCSKVGQGEPRRSLVSFSSSPFISRSYTNPSGGALAFWFFLSPHRNQIAIQSLLVRVARHFADWKVLALYVSTLTILDLADDYLLADDEEEEEGEERARVE